MDKVQPQLFNCIQLKAKHIIKSHSKVTKELNLVSQKIIVWGGEGGKSNGIIFAAAVKIL